VIGASRAREEERRLAHEVGRLLAQAGAIVVCGGLGGVMEACARGASAAGGLTVGILPGLEREEGNPYLSVALPTGLGELRNGLVVRASEALIAIGKGYGTLSEIALARRTGRSCILLESFQGILSEPPLVGPLGGELLVASTPQAAVELALAQAAARGGG